MRAASRLLAGLMLLVLACSGTGNKAKGQGGLAVRDQLGREVRFEQPVQRVVSLAPSITETIYALGAEARLVGVTTYCDYPPEARQKEQVGDFFLPNLEKMVALKPDVVFLVATGQSQTLSKLEGLGLRTFVLNPESSEPTLESFRLMGKVLGLENNAALLCRQVQTALDSVREKARGQADHPLVYIEIDSAPLISCGGKSFVGELVRTAGGRDLFEDLPQPYGVINAEKVVAGKPEVIILAHPNVKARDVRERIGWGAIPAVKAGRIYDDLNPDILTRQGPRMGQAAELLYQAFNERK
jgi:iron complex transport system substrate-binding protein